MHMAYSVAYDLIIQGTFQNALGRSLNCRRAKSDQLTNSQLRIPCGSGFPERSVCFAVLPSYTLLASRVVYLSLEAVRNLFSSGFERLVLMR